MTAGPIEQLHYTWAAKGAEGINRFQIAAISPGLKSSAMGSLLPVIRRVCRYERPAGGEDVLPRSFGWFEHRAHRIAFLRVAIPRERDRRGNFTAHIVVAPAGLLSEADVASTFGSPFWWTGEVGGREEGGSEASSGFVLPTIDRADLLRERTEPPPAPPPAALVLARGLLALPAEGRLSVADDGTRFGPALRLLARRLPEALDGVSLSTYEGGSPGAPFDVIGGPRTGAGPGGCDLAGEGSLDPEARGLLEELLGTGEEPERLRVAARRGTPVRTGRAGGALWEVAGSLRALAAAEGSIDAAAIRALGTPEAILYLCRVPPGVANVAVAARGGGAAILGALRGAWAEMSGGTRDALGAALSEAQLAAGDLCGTAALAGAVPEGSHREAILDRALAAALGDEGLARSLGPDDAALLLERAARSRVGAEQAGGLLQAVASHLGRCAELSALPRSYLAAMFRAALVGDGEDAQLVEALLRHPALLLDADLSEGEKDRCLALLGRLPPPQLERVLPALLPRLAGGDRRQPLEAALDRLSTGAAGRVLIQAMAGARGDEAARRALSEICEERAVPLIAAGVTPLALELLGASSSDSGQAAAELLRATVHRSPGSAIDAARRSASIEPPALRGALAERALACALDDARGPGEVTAVWATLEDAYPGAGAEERLRLLLEFGLLGTGGVGTAAMLAWIAGWLLPERQDMLRRTGGLRDRKAEDLARDVAAGTPWHCMREMEPHVNGAGRRCLSWWKGLEAHRRKEAKRREDSL